METSLVLSPGERRLSMLRSSVQLLEYLTTAGRLLCAVVQEGMELRRQEDERSLENMLQAGQVWEDLNPRGKGRHVRLVAVDEATVIAEHVQKGTLSTIRRDSFVGRRPRFKQVVDGS